MKEEISEEKAKQDKQLCTKPLGKEVDEKTTRKRKCRREVELKRRKCRREAELKRRELKEERKGEIIVVRLDSH